MTTYNSRADYLIGHEEDVIDTTFCRVFHDTAKAYPNDIAVTVGGRSVTYRGLERIAECAARALVRDGAERGSIIAVATGRSIESIAGMIAIFKAGCAYVYLDSAYPEERKKRVIEECRCPFVLDEEWWERLRRDEVQLMAEDGETDLSENHGLAIIVYTSGSTSYPKGVMVDHRNLLAVVYHFVIFGTSRGEHYGVFPGFGFVASVSDIFSSLAVGATICIIQNDIRKNIRALADYYREYGIQITFLPPHMARKLLSLDLTGIPLRLLLVGSEPVRNLGHRPDGQPWPFKVFNVYGMSEMCSMIAHYEIKEGCNDMEISPVGKVTPMLKGYLVKDDGTLAQPGENGELWLAGDQVTRGYFSDPVRTAATYIKNPFSDDPRLARVIKTNDILTELPDGNMRYVCRKDNVLKVRGFRVENTAVEQVMMECAPMKEAAAVAFMDDGGCNILCGYFTADEKIDVKAVKERMKLIVPYYMVPTCLIQLDSLPLNVNSKVDRKALQPPKELNNHKLLAELY